MSSRFFASPTSLLAMACGAVLCSTAACSGPPPPVATPRPPPTATAVTAARRNPSDAPVTVSHRAAIAAQAGWLQPVWRDGMLQGMARLWPSAQQVKVLFEVKGTQGTPVFLLPDIGWVDISSSGKIFLGGEQATLHDIAGSTEQKIGAWTHGHFFEGGQKLYVWAPGREGVWDVASAKLLIERLLDTGGIDTSASVHGARVVRSGQGFLRVTELPSLRPILEHDAVHSCLAPGADAVLSFTSAPFSAKDERPAIIYQRIAPPGKPIRKPGVFLSTLPSACAFDTARERVAWTMGGIEMFDAKAGRIRTIAAGAEPMHERYAIYNLAFTADGNHVCAEQSGNVAVHRADGGGVLRDTPLSSVHCFFGRPAVVARVPGTKGFEKLPSVAGLHYRRFTQSATRDMKTAAVVQIERVPAGKADAEETKRKLALILSDIPAGTVRHRIVLGEAFESELSLFDVSFVHQDRTVTVRGGPIAAAYDVGSGKPAPMPELRPLDLDPSASYEVGGLDISDDGVTVAATGKAVAMGSPAFSSIDVTGTLVVLRSRSAALAVDLAQGRTVPAPGPAPASSEEKPASARAPRVWVDGANVHVVTREGEPEKVLRLPRTLDEAGPWSGLLVPRVERVLVFHANAVVVLDLSGNHLATIVPSSRESAVAFFPDGRYERLGPAGAEDGLFCRDGLKLVPLADCSRDLELTGRLSKLF